MSFSALRTLLPLALLAACLSGGCASSTSDGVLRPISVADAQQVVQGKSTFLGLVKSGPAIWVDARPQTDYAAGHIPGAISLPFERVSLDHKTLDQYDVIIVYGNDYNDDRAKAMSKRLVDLGHSDVRTLIGGMRAWKSDGNEVETDPAHNATVQTP